VWWLYYRESKKGKENIALMAERDAEIADQKRVIKELIDRYEACCFRLHVLSNFELVEMEVVTKGYRGE
jgi:hypothetical protein